MKKTQKTILLLFAVVLSLSTYAQRGPEKATPEERAAKMTAHLTEQLELNEEQVAAIKAIHLKYGEKMRALRTEGKSRNEMRASMQELRPAIDTEIKAVLTEEQAAKFAALPKPHRPHHRERKEAHREKRQAMKKVHEDKILPLLLEQRIKLDAKLEKEDQERLAVLRQAVAEKKAAAKQAHKERREARKAVGPPSMEEREAHRAERQQRKEAMKTDPLFQEINAMVAKYESDIESLLAEIEPEIKAIKKEAKAAHKEAHGKHHGGRKGKAKRSATDKSDFKAEKQKRKYAHFLLLDPVASEEKEEATTLTNVKVYPNPTLGESQLEYTLKAASFVTIELHDESGNLLKVIEQADQPAGTNVITVNFTPYSTGIFYVIIRDDKGNTTSSKVIK